MPVFLLCVRAELENVGLPRLAPGSDFCLDVQEAGGSEVRKGVVVSPGDEVELEGSRGSAHLALRFAKGGKESSITILDPKDLKGVLKPGVSADDGSSHVPIAAFECRGLEPIGFHPQGGWVAEAASSSTKWEDVDLSEGEWTEYDEKAGESVGVMAIDAVFKTHRG